jgi:hypothetical protein
MRTYISETGKVFIDHDISYIKDIKWLIDNEYWADIKFEIPQTHGSIKGKQVDVVESFMLSFENVEAVEKMINGLSEVANLMHKQQKETAE